MIQGVVNARHEGIVRLRVRGPAGVEIDVDVIVDTGYSAALTLPVPAITTLGLILLSGSAAVLADGSMRQFDVFGAEVWWAGAWQPVLVSAVGNESLLGMRLMAGHKIMIDVVPGGLLEISPLP